ncbi:ABC transporter ATP-binding protein [Paenibacillus sambharensis]|uniref:Carnitine transport ATP-binding protein OpuCA n=1 Tax=Paenibacillus sambharensis TaxID=1803190 RepID=A0A2W1LQV5_9BACL|nr:ABC transporter ATP-binding protein [Paenibacillus sambharensis]PZD96894.1 ABC transporter ATP-binding protein [Paenibacillus sambharensis]
MSIQITGVTKRFGRTEVLQNISLTIESGEFMAILGPSGCGKTTLLRLLAGFEEPTEGEIVLNGKRMSAPGWTMPPEQRLVGMVFQSFALWPHLSVREHVAFPLKHHRGVSAALRQRVNERVAEVLELVGLAHLANRQPHQLSGGQKQRVALARAIAAEPELLLMDEPLSSLDAMLRMDMRREIQNIHHTTGAAIVYVTHDQGEALAMADRIVVMNGGRMEQVGTPEQIYLHPETEFVARFVSKANLIPGIWQGSRFVPKGAGCRWDGRHVAQSFQSSKLFPARPDELKLGAHEQEGAEPGLLAEIINVQFQGKEYHYIVKTDGNLMLDVHADERFGRGERVTVTYREQSGHRIPAVRNFAVQYQA